MRESIPIHLKEFDTATVELFKKVFDAEGRFPIYLERSDKAATEVYKKWLYPVGEFGFIPTTPTKYLEAKEFDDWKK